MSGVPMKKVDQLRAMMAADDWRGALKLAAGWANLGAEREAIQLGWSAISQPEFYRQIRKDPDALVAAGIEALKRRYRR